ncbi:MAG: DUF2281 domain-containing protein [Chitinivibrionales bacterium]|nr:DUF2281 domain-containing protein [Chitinivibrionales bacterium]
MELADKIYKHLQNLPESAQTEVFDFVSYLEEKKKNDEFATENKLWSALSIEQAMTGLEDEPDLYFVHDIQESFQ